LVEYAEEVFKVMLKISFKQNHACKSVEIEIRKERTALRLIKFTVQEDCSHLYVQPNRQT